MPAIKSLTGILALLSVLMLGIYLLFGAGLSDSMESFLSTGQAVPVDLGEAKELAKSKGNSHAGFDFNVVNVTESGLEQPFFEGVYFLYVWGELGHSESAPVAVNIEGEAFLLPEEFNDLANVSTIHLASAEDALNFLSFYLQFWITWPGADRHIIIEEIRDIPGFSDQNESLSQLQSVVNPVDITDVNNGWNIDFYSWRAISGIVFHWEMKIFHDGKVNILQKQIIGEKTGDYLTIE